jgi:hypothetical protein
MTYTSIYNNCTLSTYSSACEKNRSLVLCLSLSSVFSAQILDLNNSTEVDSNTTDISPSPSPSETHSGKTRNHVLISVGVLAGTVTAACVFACLIERFICRTERSREIPEFSA